MSGERDTLERSFLELDAEERRTATWEYTPPSSWVTGLAELASQEIEAIHAMYRPRIERLEVEIERLTKDLAAIRALVDSRGVV